uniref:Uncharacterized protein n=1 Tax=Oryza punctata TaxID=4537 RepID=A0A0E0JJJ4_ORYPU
MESWIERQAKAEADEEAAIAAGMKKKKKLVRTRVPNGRVEFMMKHPFTTACPFSEEELAKRSASYRQLHSISKFIDRKMNDYEQVLIEQYIKQGYAEDESEITDDDDEEQYKLYTPGAAISHGRLPAIGYVLYHWADLHQVRSNGNVSLLHTAAVKVLQLLLIGCFEISGS